MVMSPLPISRRKWWRRLTAKDDLLEDFGKVITSLHDEIGVLREGIARHAVDISVTRKSRNWQVLQQALPSSLRTAQRWAERSREYMTALVARRRAMQSCRGSLARPPSTRQLYLSAVLQDDEAAQGEVEQRWLWTTRRSRILRDPMSERPDLGHPVTNAATRARIRPEPIGEGSVTRSFVANEQYDVCCCLHDG